MVIPLLRNLTSEELCSYLHRCDYLSELEKILLQHLEQKIKEYEKLDERVYDLENLSFSEVMDNVQTLFRIEEQKSMHLYEANEKLQTDINALNLTIAVMGGEDGPESN